MASGIRQRRSPNENTSGALAQHVEQDTIFGDETEEEPDTSPPPPPGMSFVARILVFLAFPLFIGLAGLVLGYLMTFHDKSRKVDFDNDFVFPFLMALVLVMVLSIQTKGFTGSMAPLVRWPKVRRRKKIIRKRVIVDDDGNEISPKED
jgi:hypothetical protein